MRQRPELTGCSSDAALQEPVRDVVRLFDRDERLVPTTALDRALAGVSAQSDQHWLQRRGDSAPVPIAEIARPLVDAHGNIDGAVLVLRDALAQRAAAETSRLQLAVVDASPDAIVGIDAQGRIVSWNGAAQRIFGYDEAHAHGRALDTLVAQRGCGATRSPYRSRRCAGRSARSKCCACAATAGAFARRCPRAPCAAMRATASRCR
jgi:PAS domain-containing protein